MSRTDFQLLIRDVILYYSCRGWDWLVVVDYLLERHSDIIYENWGGKGERR